MAMQPVIKLDGQTVLVTGAGGFIGSHLVERLVALGINVRAFVRYTSRFQAGFLDELEPAVKREIETIRGDLRDADAVRQAMQGVQTAFHLAALIGIPYSYTHPRETVEVNVVGTLNVLMAAQLAGVGRLVHTSSSEVYGTAQYVPIDELHPLQAQSPYAASKIGADKLVESFFHSYALPVVTLRPFNTYGPRQSARAVIPTIISQALEGEVIRLGNLSPTRDFTYVSDTVEAFIRAAEADGVIGRIVNLGTGNKVSISDLVDKIGLLMGKSLKVQPESVRRRPQGSEVKRLLSDNRLAKQLLGWKPLVSLDEGLQYTIRWIRENQHMFGGEYYVI